MSIHEGKDEKAAAKGLVVVRPQTFELFVDLDSEAAATTFWTNAPILEDVIQTFRFAPSQSGKPWRFHVYVTLKRDVRDALERIMLQCLLGSDLLHEVLSWREAAIEKLDDPTVFFERATTPAHAPPPAPEKPPDDDILF
jgi:hypothetical protein